MTKALRHRYIDALVDAGWWPRPDHDVKRIIDAILAVRDEEMQRLRQQAERVRADERTQIAAMVRHYFAPVDDPLFEDVRILCGRIERGEHAATEADQSVVVPTPSANPVPEMRCSECGRPLVDQPCGLVHAIVRMQIAAIRTGLSSLLKGGGHG